MNILTRKKIIGLTTGVIMLAGVASPFTVQAAAENGGSWQPPEMQQCHFNPDKIAQRIADTYGVNKEAVLKYHNEGVNFKEVSQGAFLAKASGKSLKEVMEVKTYDNTWKDVAQALGVTKEQIKATRNVIAATQLENKLHISKQTSLDLMQQGYRARDIAVANALANNTGKPIIDVLAMKKINNTWHDVASSLGVDDNTFKQDMKDLKTAFHHNQFRGPHQSIMM
jgi:capsular polysaccharide biosynthesis protein